ncbi:MAG: poly-gamma-glutamate hydrolase family protein [Paracoccaceae bacterium]
MRKNIETHLNENGFRTLSHGHLFPASDPNNLCNRGPTKQGAQIELPSSLRISLMKDPDLLTTLAQSLHNAIGP